MAVAGCRLRLQCRGETSLNRQDKTVVICFRNSIWYEKVMVLDAGEKLVTCKLLSITLIFTQGRRVKEEESVSFAVQAQPVCIRSSAN